MRKTLGMAAIMFAFLAPLAVQAQEAEISANAGWVSQYYYRGILQKSSSASAGLDLASGVFSMGTWAADVGDGAEVDLYAAFGFDLTDNVSVSAGGTGYFYTGGFDDTYLEGNFGLGLGLISVEYSLGSYKTSPTAVDYSFLGITLEGENGLFVTGGAFGDDLALGGLFDSGHYVEAGYGFSAADLDFVISGIFNDSSLSGEVSGPRDAPTSELTLVFGVSKAFGPL